MPPVPPPPVPPPLHDCLYIHVIVKTKKPDTPLTLRVTARIRWLYQDKVSGWRAGAGRQQGMNYTRTGLQDMFEYLVVSTPIISKYWGHLWRHCKYTLLQGPTQLGIDTDKNTQIFLYNFWIVGPLEFNIILWDKYVTECMTSEILAKQKWCRSAWFWTNGAGLSAVGECSRMTILNTSKLVSLTERIGMSMEGQPVYSGIWEHMTHKEKKNN